MPEAGGLWAQVAQFQLCYLGTSSTGCHAGTLGEDLSIQEPKALSRRKGALPASRAVCPVKLGATLWESRAALLGSQEVKGYAGPHCEPTGFCAGSPYPLPAKYLVPAAT